MNKILKYTYVLIDQKLADLFNSDCSAKKTHDMSFLNKKC